jgi:hypothetical protein
MALPWLRLPLLAAVEAAFTARWLFHRFFKSGSGR